MKKRTGIVLVLISCAFVGTSCGPSATSDTSAAEAAAIRALDEQWSATAARSDLEGTVAFYADDAVLLPGNAPIARHRKAIRDPKGGAPVRDTGKLVEIWKKQADGKWKCIVDTYNSDLPAAPAPEAKK